MKPCSIALLLAGTLALGACDQVDSLSFGPTYPTKSVTVFSRTWAVTQVAEAPVTYRATRDWNNLNPFGRPARPRTGQAVSAIQQATGCRVIRQSMYQNIEGQFFSQVSCPPAGG